MWRTLLILHTCCLVFFLQTRCWFCVWKDSPQLQLLFLAPHTSGFLSWFLCDVNHCRISKLKPEDSLLWKVVQNNGMSKEVCPYACVCEEWVGGGVEEQTEIHLWISESSNKQRIVLTPLKCCSSFSANLWVFPLCPNVVTDQAAKRPPLFSFEEMSHFIGPTHLYTYTIVQRTPVLKVMQVKRVCMSRFTCGIFEQILFFFCFFIEVWSLSSFCKALCAGNVLHKGYLWSLNQLLGPLAEWTGAKSCWEIKSANSDGNNGSFCSMNDKLDVITATIWLLTAIRFIRSQ